MRDKKWEDETRDKKMRTRRETKKGGDKSQDEKNGKTRCKIKKNGETRCEMKKK